MTIRSPGLVVRSALVALAVGVGLWLVWPDVTRAAWLAAYGIAGGVLIVRRPRNVIGWLLGLIALSFTGITDLTAEGIAELSAGTTDAVTTFRVWIGAMSGAWAFLGYALLGLVFPTGRLPRGRWRRPLVAVIAAALVVIGSSMVHPMLSVTIAGGTATTLVPNPYAVLPTLDAWALLPNADVAFLPVIVLLVVSVLSVIVRARRATGVERLQLRWLTASLATLLLAVLVGAVLVLVVGPTIGGLAWLPASVAFLTVPIAVLVAVLRYRLLDIDRIVSRTIGWALVTASLVAIFAVAVIALQAVLDGVTQGDTLAVAASTLLAAAAFQPIHGRLQRWVDQRFDRAAYDRERILARVGGRLRDEVDLEAIQGQVLASTADAVRPSASGIWLRPRAGR